MNSAAERKGRFRRLRIGAMVLVVLVAAGGLAAYMMAPERALLATDATTYTVTRGPMEITVIEGGSIEAKESSEIKCEVPGQRKILSIVEEGYMITQEDVQNGKVLVELDSKDLIDRQTEQELQYQNALASFTEAREEFGIQINQNASDVKQAELEVKFKRMDFEKYLGADVANEILARLRLDKVEAQLLEQAAASTAESVPSMEETEAAALNGEERPEGGSEQEVLQDTVADLIAVAQREAGVNIDFRNYADDAKLGDGEARQQLRKLEDDLVLAQEEVGLAESKLEGTQRLFEREFVTRNDLENDEMAYKRKEISEESAETAKQLFIKYEFPKEAERLLTDYQEALRALQRATKTAVSKLAQARAKLNSAEARFKLQARERKELEEQIAKCVIRAERPGLVVYGGDEPYWRQERIEEGADVRERQVLITIPDTTVMTVEAKVHESVVKRVQPGQHARISVDAFPDERLAGSVDKIAVLPDSTNRWMNPDLKVYSTTIVIGGQAEWLKPGMSAEVEIVIDQLKDVLQVPLQAVTASGEDKVCYVVNGGEAEKRTVKTGDFNESFIAIADGLEAGEEVLLRAPRAMGGGAEAPAEEEAPPESAQPEEQTESPGRGRGSGGGRPG